MCSAAAAASGTSAWRTPGQPTARPAAAASKGARQKPPPPGPFALYSAASRRRRWLSRPCRSIMAYRVLVETYLGALACGQIQCTWP